MRTIRPLLAGVGAWWVFFTVHPTQPFLGPFPTEVTCLRAALLATELMPKRAPHAAVDCRDFSEVEHQ